ncbi:MAG TPA: shikimate dehydrogenase [Gemmatimonadota bacterium]|nr:shikimate dehydrogenase [Gemmatimonadota bacterium]
MTGAAEPSGSVDRTPRLFALLGGRVRHSLSPVLHRAAFGALGVEAAYGLLAVDGDEVGPVMRALARQGGGNVTLPHKGRAAAALEHASGAVRATGSCNCFWGEADGGLAGDNTDVRGFLEAAGDLLPGAPGGARVLLLGAGGAARAVLHACLAAGAASVEVLDRTPERARAMAREVGGDDSRVHVVEGGPGSGEGAVRAALQPPPGERDLVVNATSLGLEPGDALPMDPARLGGAAALDLVYGERETAWARAAREAGSEAADGLGMLVAQAAASLRRWLGVEPPVEAMRAAALSATGRDR